MVRELFTKSVPADGVWPMLPDDSKSLDQIGFYDPNTRCINAKTIADAAKDLFNTKYSATYADSFSNSAMLGFSCKFAFWLPWN